MYREKDSEDLHNEIIALKKDNINIKSENALLKVKVRKLEAQLNRKDKQIDDLIAPIKSPKYRKLYNDISTSMILNLRDKLQRCESINHEKDYQIKRLKEQLSMIKLYPPDDQRKCSSSLGTNFDDKTYKIISFLLSDNNDNKTKIEIDKQNMDLFNEDEDAKINVVAPSITEEPVNISEDTIKNPYQDHNREKNNSPESDLFRTELYEHDDVKKLETHFLDMFLEVDMLKTTICKLHAQQHQTMEVLNEKDCDIEQLADEIKSLKMNKKGSKKKKLANIEKIYRPRSVLKNKVEC